MPFRGVNLYTLGNKNNFSFTSHLENIFILKLLFIIYYHWSNFYHSIDIDRFIYNYKPKIFY